MLQILATKATIVVQPHGQLHPRKGTCRASGYQCLDSFLIMVHGDYVKVINFVCTCYLHTLHRLSHSMIWKGVAGEGGLMQMLLTLGEVNPRYRLTDLPPLKQNKTTKQEDIKHCDRPGENISRGPDVV